MARNKADTSAGKDDEPVVIETKPGHHKDIGGGDSENWNLRQMQLMRAAALQCCLGFVRRSKNGLQSTDLRLMNMRSLESRIAKLERRTRHQGEMLLIWCAEDRI